MPAAGALHDWQPLYFRLCVFQSLPQLPLIFPPKEQLRDHIKQSRRECIIPCGTASILHSRNLAILCNMASSLFPLGLDP